MKYYVVLLVFIISGFFIAYHFLNIQPAEKNSLPILAAETTSTSVVAQLNTLPPKTPTSSIISAQSFLSELVDAEGNIQVVAEKNSNAKLPIASITKLITAIIAVDNYDLGETITVPRDIEGKKGSAGKLKIGEMFLIGELLYPLLIESDNDAGRILASKMGEEKFVERMNQKVVLLGLADTHFINPVGVDPDDASEPNHSTVRDVAKLALVIMKQYPKILNIMSLKEYDLKIASGTLHHALTTTNKLLGENFPLDIIGGKTGETPRAKKNLLLITQKPGENTYVVSVVLGSDDNFGDMKKLLIRAPKNLP